MAGVRVDRARAGAGGSSVCGAGTCPGVGWGVCWRGAGVGGQWGGLDPLRAERPDEWRRVVGGEALGGVPGFARWERLAVRAAGWSSGAVGGLTRGGTAAGRAVGRSSGVAGRRAGSGASERSRAAFGGSEISAGGSTAAVWTLRSLAVASSRLARWRLFFTRRLYAWSP